MTTSACSDFKFNLTGSSWQTAFHWSFKANSTPSNLLVNGSTLAAVEGILKHAVGNITHERNDCDRPDRVSRVPSMTAAPTSARTFAPMRPAAAPTATT